MNSYESKNESREREKIWKNYSVLAIADAMRLYIWYVITLQTFWIESIECIRIHTHAHFPLSK